MSVSEILPYPAKRFPYRPQVPYLKILQQKNQCLLDKIARGVAWFGLYGPRLRTASLDHSCVKIYIL